MKHQAIFSASALLLLAACGGDGAVNGSDPFANVDLPSGPPGYVALAKEAFVLGDKLEDVTSFTVPTRGSATFDGILALTDDYLSPTDTYTGNLTATADFTNATMSGNASGFYYAAGDGTGVGVPVPGSVSISSSDTDTATTTGFFVVDVSGNVDLSSVSGSADGFYAGANADMLAGIGDGTVNLGTSAWDIIFLAD